MKITYIIFILFLCSSSLISGEYIIFDKNFSYDTFFNSNDTTLEDLDNSNSQQLPFKSPSKALISSAIFPGGGQFYMNNDTRGLIFIVLETIAIGTWYTNNIKADEITEEYKDYASLHWDFSRWIHDYYKWYEYKDDEQEWNEIRNIFINRSDNLSQCDEKPWQDRCFIDIDDTSHDIHFTYNNEVMSNRDPEFKSVFKTICQNSYIGQPSCTIDFEDMDLKDDNGATIYSVPAGTYPGGSSQTEMQPGGSSDQQEWCLSVGCYTFVINFKCLCV